MKMRAFFLFMSIYFTVYPQVSSVKIDSGNKNDISVTQTGSDSSQRSDIAVIKSDSNKVRVSQTPRTDSTKKKEEETGFTGWVTHANNFFVLLISIATFIGLLWKGLPYLKKSTPKK
jgi:hypothetical protein